MIVKRSDLTQVANDLMKHFFISIDTETTGLMWDDKPFMFSMATKSGRYVFNLNPYPDLEWGSVLTKEDLVELLPVFNRKDVVWFIHNAKFDMRMLYKLGIELKGPVHCTMAIERVIKNNLMSYSLENLAKRRNLVYTKTDEVKKYITKHKLWTDYPVLGKTKIDRRKHFDKVPWSVMAPYAENDAVLHFDLGIDQIKRIRDINREEAPSIDYPRGDRISSIMDVVNNEIALTKVCFEMEKKGIRIDKAYTAEALEDAIHQINIARKEFREMTGKEYMDSNVLFAEIFKDNGYTYPMTEKGNPSFTKESLSDNPNPIARKILEIRELEKFAGTYYSSFLYYCGSDGRIHANMNQGGTETGRFSYSNPNCLSLDTEVLTPLGWKTYKEINVGDFVFQYVCGNLERTPVLKKYVSKKNEKEMVEVKKQHVKMRLTANHRVLWRDRKTGEIKITPASNFPKDGHILHGAPYMHSESPEIHPDFIKLMVAIQADGSFTAGKQVYFGLYKNRKIERLCDILDSLNISYTRKVQARGRSRIAFVRQEYPLLTGKEFNDTVLRLSPNQRTTFLNELRYWDGSSTRKSFDYCSNSRKNIDIIQASAALNGWRCHVYRHSNGKAWIASFTFRNYTGTANIHKKTFTSRETVWCIEVDKGNFLARRNGDTFITGNCQNVPKEEDYEGKKYLVRKCFIPDPDFTFVMIDYDQQEFRMMLDYAGETRLIEEVNKGADVHQATADLLNISRTKAKTINFASIYGVGTVQLSKMLGINLRQTNLIKADYFAKLPKVQKFIHNVMNRGEDRGYIRNWMGRRCHLQAKKYSYILPNHLIQGGCADVIKKAMVILYEYLRPYKSHMLLQVHDELLFQIHKDEYHIVPELKKIMESVYTPINGMKLTCSVEHSHVSWGSSDKLEGMP